MRGVHVRATGWRAEVMIFAVVALVALGALTATTWMGVMVGDLAWWLGATRRAADVVEGAASSIATAGIIAGMVQLGRWSRSAAPGVITSDPAAATGSRGVVCDETIFGADGNTVEGLAE